MAGENDRFGFRHPGKGRAIRDPRLAPTPRYARRTDGAQFARARRELASLVRRFARGEAALPTSRRVAGKSAQADFLDPSSSFSDIEDLSAAASFANSRP